MKAQHYIFVLVLLAILFFVEYDLSSRVEMAKILKLNSPISNVKNQSIKIGAGQVVKPVVDNIPPVNSEVFMKRFKNESLQIVKIQNNSELVEIRMKNLAQAMNPQDVEGLFELISNDKINADQRALAVELLSLKNDTTSLMALQNFVANNLTFNGTKWDRKNELETILRAQAIESIAAFPQKEIALSTLSFLQQKVDEKFLNDRIGRATASLTNHSPSLSQQDDDALKKLIE